MQCTQELPQIFNSLEIKILLTIGTAKVHKGEDRKEAFYIKMFEIFENAGIKQHY